MIVLENLVTRRVSEENASKSSLTGRVTKQGHLLLAALAVLVTRWWHRVNFSLHANFVRCQLIVWSGLYDGGLFAATTSRNQRDKSEPQIAPRD